MPVPATVMMDYPDPMMMDSAMSMPMGFDVASLWAMVSSMMGTGVLILIGLLLFIIPLFLMYEFLSYCRMFQKAGIPLWAPLVPIYNLFIPLKIIRKSYWYFFILILPLAVNVVPFNMIKENPGLFLAIGILLAVVYVFFIIKFVHCLSKKFGHGSGFTVGLIFLPWIFIPILAFGKSRYESTPEIIIPVPEEGEEIQIKREPVVIIPEPSVEREEPESSVPPVV